MRKEWRDVLGYGGLYKVSNYGEAFSYLSNRKIGTPAPNGYPRVGLYKNGKLSRKFIHVLVLEAFKGKRPKGLVCNHIDEDITNNKLDNLEWVTPKQNVNHSIYPGSGSYEKRYAFGEKEATPIIALHSGKWYPSLKAAELELGLRKNWISEQFYGRAHVRHFYQFRKANNEKS